jgi:hypothetical protein
MLLNIKVDHSTQITKPIQNGRFVNFDIKQTEKNSQELTSQDDVRGQENV